MPNKRGTLMRHLLMLSMALNSVLILRLIYTSGISWEAEKSLQGFCMAENQEIGKVVVASSSSSSGTSTDGRIPDENGGGKLINLGHGDPTMYAKFWHQMGNKTTLVIPGWQSISYFSDVKNLCWFMEPDLTKAVIRLHKLVGNAITKDRHIVVGTGSSQLFQAALYALCPAESSEPTSVISAAPYYSSYPLMTDFLKSGLYKWGGDAHKFRKRKNQAYIELVTSPNNPDGSIRQAVVVNGSDGIVIHDLAYYWPQYTPITFHADYDLMLFTVSKSTGHAGSRIGWAVVKNEEVARKMTKFIEVNTIGVSKDSQLRAAKILNSVADTYDYSGNAKEEGAAFFEYSYGVMNKRWNQLKEAVRKNPIFSLPVFPWSYCNFSGRKFESQPAFAWLKCEGEIEDCEKLLGDHKILTRGGKHFGFSSKYVRISMLEIEENFDIFTDRLSRIHVAGSG
ncbi:tryptophan aminotransferase-related protein 2-like [Impatiens glandulifera]|uniref:tryptophan aminotransferase-related protein 2-like n=1 Tax=Impatiens glandulifera TaxID=253017 RepID=UPI001FB18426|nr:tryptophan aminotransferase-related protein 2-like [Impatiens glandulifera]